MDSRHSEKPGLESAGIGITLRTLFVILFIFSIRPLSAPAAETDAGEKETDPLVLRKLESFKDWKFGLMMHWGPYSQWGVVESWTLCSEDEPWCRRKLDDYVEYKKQYEALPKTFNPAKFDPAKWAKAAKEAGMKYVVFTTKHHDGFSMFDTKQTGYRITSPDCPFHENPKSNITKEIFDAFRGEGFGIGAYFSKPDWHSPDFWAPEWATPDRNVNYSIEKYPERWQRFRDFTRKQIEELVSGYGKIDILWLDGGWVRPMPMAELAPGYFIKNPKNQDIDMPGIAAMTRRHQPGLLVVDRTVTGKYENYRTPEQEVPEKALDYAWETCMTMGDQWSYKPDDRYKSANRLIHLLVDIVAKGGNFLLNIGPSPEGELPAEALSRLKDIGDWMKTNGEAIYGTRPVAPYKETKVCFTGSGMQAIYAIYLADEDEATPPPTIMLYSLAPKKGTVVRMLGVDEPVSWEKSGKGVLLRIPKSAIARPPCKHAWVFKIRR